MGSYNSEEPPVSAEEGKEVGGRWGALLGVQTAGKCAGRSREGRPPHRGSRRVRSAVGAASLLGQPRSSRAAERPRRVFAALQRAGGGPRGPLAGVGRLRGVQLVSAAWFNVRISPSVSQHLEDTSFSADTAAALDGHLPFGTLKTEEMRTVSILEAQREPP